MSATLSAECSTRQHDKTTWLPALRATKGEARTPFQTQGEEPCLSRKSRCIGAADIGVVIFLKMYNVYVILAGQDRRQMVTKVVFRRRQRRTRAGIHPEKPSVYAGFQQVAPRRQLSGKRLKKIIVCFLRPSTPRRFEMAIRTAGVGFGTTLTPLTIPSNFGLTGVNE